MMSQSNEEFLISVEDALTLTTNGAQPEQALAFGGWFDSIKQEVSRLIATPAADSTTLATALRRKKVHMGASRFLGDLFIYLDSRGSKDQPGHIVERVRYP
jgi:hypothetical protein